MPKSFGLLWMEKGMQGSSFLMEAYESAVICVTSVMSPLNSGYSKYRFDSLFIVNM